MKKRTIIFISDSTGITAETIGETLLTQFNHFELEKITIPYVTSVKQAQDIAETINQLSKTDQASAVIFSTLVNPDVRKVFESCDAILLDLFATFIPRLEKAFDRKYIQGIGKLRGITDIDKYEMRMDTVQFALNTDNRKGLALFPEADVILVGPSRSGKTSICLYMALQFGIKAANYSLSEKQLQRLPRSLKSRHSKLVGILINPKRLQDIHKKQQSTSRYIALKQCKDEMTQMKELFRTENMPYIDVTTFSIEEIATKIIETKQLKRHF